MYEMPPKEKQGFQDLHGLVVLSLRKALLYLKKKHVHLRRGSPGSIIKRALARSVHQATSQGEGPARPVDMSDQFSQQSFGLSCGGCPRLISFNI